MDIKIDGRNPAPVEHFLQFFFTRVLYDVLFGAGTGVSSRNPFSMHPKDYQKHLVWLDCPHCSKGARPSVKDAGNARISNAEP